MKLLACATAALACASFAMAGASAKRLVPVVWDSWNWNSLAATDKNTFPSAFNTVEYQRLRSFQVPGMVYVRNSTMLFDLAMYNGNAVSDTGTLTVSNASFLCDNGTSFPLLINGFTSQSYTVSIPGPGSFSVPTMTITGMPDYVTKGRFLMFTQVTSPKGLSGAGYIDYTTYLTDFTPVGTQLTPWLDVLNYACVWADTHKDTYPPMVDCTKGLNHDALMTFPATDFKDYWINPANNKFQLKNFFNATTTRYGNSRDVASFLKIAANALGEAPVLKKLKSDPAGNPSREGFVTNYVIPIGSTSSRRIYLGEQVIDTLPEPNTTNTWIYDSTFKQLVDLSGLPYNEVPYEWRLAKYWQTTLATSPPYVGLVSRFGYPYGIPADIRTSTTNYVEPTFADELVARINSSVSLAGVE